MMEHLPSAHEDLKKKKEKPNKLTFVKSIWKFIIAIIVNRKQ